MKSRAVVVGVLIFVLFAIGNTVWKHYGIAEAAGLDELDKIICVLPYALIGLVGGYYIFRE